MEVGASEVESKVFVYCCAIDQEYIVVTILLTIFLKLVQSHFFLLPFSSASQNHQKLRSRCTLACVCYDTEWAGHSQAKYIVTRVQVTTARSMH